MKTTKSSQDIFCYFHKDLTANWYPKWLACIRKKLPADFNITDAEIDSEITMQCQYLAKNFKGGSYQAYCNLYVEKLVLKALYKEYKLLDHKALANALNDFDESYKDSYAVQSQIVNGYKIVQKKLDDDYAVDKWTKMYEVAFVLDKQTDWLHSYAEIVDMLKMKMSYREIAEDLNVSKDTICKRIAKIVERVKATEEEINEASLKETAE